MNDEKFSLQEVKESIEEAIDECVDIEESFPVYGGIIHTLLAFCPLILMIASVFIANIGSGAEAEIKRWGLLIMGGLVWGVYNVINVFYYVKNSFEIYDLAAIREEILNESKD